MMLERHTLLAKCTPAVSRRLRWLIAGVVWSGVGIMLCALSGRWLSQMDISWGLSGAAIGFSSGVLIHQLGFSRIAQKNIGRIADQPGKVCLFAFQEWRSYCLIVVMMFLGYTLRHSPLPRLILAVIYSAIGTGLTLSSTLYYAQLL